MALAQLNAWRNDGSPFLLCAPAESLGATLRAHGYTVESYPDLAHLVATPAEDHTPFSQTPWPGAQPYPHCMAIDILGSNLATLGAQIFADKQAGRAGTECIKYVNWTDAAGHCWHDKWQPGHVRTSSTDRGHIHISFRTDYVDKSTAYDPVGQAGGGDMGWSDQDIEALKYRVEGVFADRPAAAGGAHDANVLHQRLNAIDATLAQILAAVAAIQPGDVTVGVDPVQLSAAVRAELDKTKLGPIG